MEFRETGNITPGGHLGGGRNKHAKQNTTDVHPYDHHHLHLHSTNSRDSFPENKNNNRSSKENNENNREL